MSKKEVVKNSINQFIIGYINKFNNFNPLEKGIVYLPFEEDFFEFELSKLDVKNEVFFHKVNLKNFIIMHITHEKILTDFDKEEIDNYIKAYTNNFTVIDYRYDKYCDYAVSIIITI